MESASHVLQLKQKMEPEKGLVKLVNVIMRNNLPSVFNYLSVFALIQIVLLIQLGNASLALKKRQMELEKLMVLLKHVHASQHLFGIQN
jgi:hypothetical protein